MNLLLPRRNPNQSRTQQCLVAAPWHLTQQRCPPSLPEPRRGQGSAKGRGARPQCPASLRGLRLVMMRGAGLFQRRNSDLAGAAVPKGAQAVPPARSELAFPALNPEKCCRWNAALR